MLAYPCPGWRRGRHGNPGSFHQRLRPAHRLCAPRIHGLVGYHLLFTGSAVLDRLGSGRGAHGRRLPLHDGRVDCRGPHREYRSVARRDCLSKTDISKSRGKSFCNDATFLLDNENSSVCSLCTLGDTAMLRCQSSPEFATRRRCATFRRDIDPQARKVSRSAFRT